MTNDRRAESRELFMGLLKEKMCAACFPVLEEILAAGFKALDEDPAGVTAAAGFKPTFNVQVGPLDE